MTKETYIKFRCSEKFKSIVEQKSKDYGKTVSGYIEYLIRKDTDIMRILANEFITEEMKEEFMTSGHCYLSSKEDFWLFDDMNFFNQMNSKYRFDGKDIDDGIYNANLQDYIEMVYADMHVNILGIPVYLGSYAEMTAETLEENIECLLTNNWDKVIDEYLKSYVMMGVKMDLMDNIVKLIDNGFDIFEIKDAVEMAERKSELEKKGYEVLYDEQYWTLDEEGILRSVVCIINNEEVDTPVTWDKFGAYVEYEGVKTYVLENNS